MRASRRAVRALLTLTLAGAAGLALAACGEDGGGDSGPTATNAVPRAGLEGPQWALDARALGISGGRDLYAWLQLTNGTVTGSDGCNALTGPYEIEGETLRFGALAGTRRACTGPADALARRVQSALPQVRRYAIAGERLTLQAADGSALLRLSLAEQTPAGAWEVVSVLYDDAIRGVLEGTRPTLTLTAGGAASGETTCNSFSGRYTVNGTALRFGPLASTERACAEADARRQEQGYVDALAATRAFRREGPKLTLLDDRGRMAVVLTRAR